PVSVPTENPHRPAANAAADPLEEPPHALRTLLSHGFLGVPRKTLTPTLPMASSLIAVMPSMTAPAALNFVMNGPSLCKNSEVSNVVPPRQSAPETNMFSLIA